MLRRPTTGVKRYPGRVVYLFEIGGAFQYIRCMDITGWFRDNLPKFPL